MPFAFETPQLLLLALPAAWLWWAFGLEGRSGLHNALRATPLIRLAIALLLVTAMAGPTMGAAPAIDV